jgi:hypothetical protein
MLRELASLVEEASVDSPLVLVLEDLHSSDHGTVDVVSVLAQRPERARVLLLGTYRPAEVTVLDHSLAQVVATLRARRRCTEIALEYLGSCSSAPTLGRSPPPVKRKSASRRLSRRLALAGRACRSFAPAARDPGSPTAAGDRARGDSPCLACASCAGCGAPLSWGAGAAE